MVIFDRVTATNASFKKSWNIHTVNPPSVDGTVSSAGDTTYSGATVTRADNGAGRVYVNHLLPASPNVRRADNNTEGANPSGAPDTANKVRTVGGNACPLIRIQGATNAKPAVFYAPGHGLVPGEAIGISTGTEGSPDWPDWHIDAKFASHSVATAPDADHFTLDGDVDTTSLRPWAAAFTSGPGSPRAPGAFPGQVYYQTNAANGNTVWQWDQGGAWIHLSTIQGYKQGLGYLSPVVYSHANCNWAYFVDQFGPPGSGSAHLWIGAMDSPAANTRPDWLVQVTPGGNHLTDYFLNVVTATTTSVSSPPTAALIEGAGVYGAQIADRAGAYVAVFTTAASPVANLAYTALHPGAAMHVVSGLQPGDYTVTQNGNAISGAYSADQAGAIAFHEKGGGAFQVSLAK
jgi:hypothetical protein